jgi:hypothetical protein
MFNWFNRSWRVVKDRLQYLLISLFPLYCQVMINFVIGRSNETIRAAFNHLVQTRLIWILDLSSNRYFLDFTITFVLVAYIVLENSWFQYDYNYCYLFFFLLSAAKKSSIEDITLSNSSTIISLWWLRCANWTWSCTYLKMNVFFSRFNSISCNYF